MRESPKRALAGALAGERKRKKAVL